MTVLEVLQTVAGVKLGLQAKHPSRNIDELVQIIVGGYQGGYPAAKSAAVLMDAIVSDGGTTNTGDATAADVAIGKTFSSAALTNVAGTSTKNATVPNDAPIQPPQAFVDNIATFIPSASSSISVANKGITHIDSAIPKGWVSAFPDLSPTIDFSGNSLTGANVEEIISAIAAAPAATGTYMNFTGCSDLPSGPAVILSAADLHLIKTVTSLHGHPVTINLGQEDIDYHGGSMSAAEVNAVLAWIVANWTSDTTYIIDLSGVSTADPTGQGLADKATLQGLGFAVYTHSNPP